MTDAITESSNPSALLSPAPAVTSQAPRQDGADAMAAALVDRGVWTQEQASAALANANAEPVEGGTLAAHVTAGSNSLELQGALISQGVDNATAGFFGDMFRKAALNPPDAATIAATSAASEEHLRTLWGDRFDGMLGLAMDEVKLMAQGLPKLPELLDRTGLGNHPTIIRVLAEQGLQRAAKRRLGMG